MTRPPRWISPLDCPEAIAPKASFQFRTLYNNWKLKTDRWLISLSQAEPCHACPRCPAISYSLQLLMLKTRNIERDRKPRPLGPRRTTDRVVSRIECPYKGTGN